MLYTFMLCFAARRRKVLGQGCRICNFAAAPVLLVNACSIMMAAV